MRVVAEARRLLARRGRQPAQGHRQEDPRADREGAHASSSRAASPTATPPSSREKILRHDRAVRRLLVQQVAQRRLRLHHVPNRVAEGEPSGAVPRRAAHEREDQPRQGRGLPQRVPPARHPGARPRRERVGERLLVRARPPSGRRHDAIRFGLSAVRNVGEGVVELIVDARDEGGPFVDFYDFCDASTRRCSTSARSSR